MYIVVNYLIVEVSLYFNNKLLCGNCSCKVDVDGFDVFDFLNFFLLLEVGINICLKVGKIIDYILYILKVNLVKV